MFSAISADCRQTADHGSAFIQAMDAQCAPLRIGPVGRTSLRAYTHRISGAYAIRPTPWRALSSHAMGTGGVSAEKCLTDFRRAWDCGQVCAFRFLQRQFTQVAGACTGHCERGVCQYFMPLVVGVNPVDAHQLIVLRLC